MSWDLMHDGPVTMAGMVGGVAEDVATGGMQTAGVQPVPGRLSTDSPMFVFGAVLAVTFGLIGASTHLRVGPFKVGADAGKA